MFSITWYNPDMVTKLSKAQQREIEKQGDKPIEVLHPETQKVYVLIAGDIYERLRQLFDDRFDIRETYAAQDEALAKVWDDPELDVYNDYEAHKPS
jgi:hypothetical protein